MLRKILKTLILIRHIHSTILFSLLLPNRAHFFLNFGECRLGDLAAVRISHEKIVERFCELLPAVENYLKPTKFVILRILILWKIGSHRHNFEGKFSKLSGRNLSTWANTANINIAHRHIASLVVNLALRSTSATNFSPTNLSSARRFRCTAPEFWGT